MRFVAILLGTYCCFISISQAFAATETIHKDQMSFNQCLATIDGTIKELGLSSRRVFSIVNTGMLNITKLVLDDANMIITCSKLDEQLLITRSTPPDLHLIK